MIFTFSEQGEARYFALGNYCSSRMNISAMELPEIIYLLVARFPVSRVR